MSEFETETENPDLLTERAVLGAMLVERGALVEAQALLTPDDFLAPRHREAFAAMGELVRRGVAVDPLTVDDELRTRQWKIGAAELTAMAAGTPAVLSLRHYAGIVAKRASLRKLKQVCADMAAKAEGEPEHAQRLVLEAQRLVTQVARGRARPGVDLADLVQPMYDELEARQSAKNTNSLRLLGLSTGVSALDEITGGFRRGTLNIIAARTSIGKTAFACQVAILGAIQEKTPVLFFSLEMRPMELTERFFSRFGDIDSSRMRTGDLSRDEWNRIYFAGGEMSKQGMVVISNTRTMGGIATEARAFRVKHPDARIALVVDYLQIVRVGEKGRTREQEVAEVSGALKELAVELDCPVISPAQLNRRSETEEEDPKVSDIRESGAIENDADVILFIVRDRQATSGICRAIVAKNRNGKVDECEVQWNGATYMLGDVSSGGGGHAS